MIHILLVEDKSNTLEELYELLREVFPDALIETASTVAEGKDKIRTAAANDQPFGIAILDFKLPTHKGLNPEIDESLCREIKSRMPETLVIHITAFHEDPAVARHITQYHTGINAPKVELIQKTAYWPEKLLSEIKTYLIRRQLDILFEGQADVPETRKAKSSSGSLTHSLAALSRDITTYWWDLDDATRERIGEYFETTVDNQQVRVNLRLRR
jgi:DNA-binding response OmpR family regulator